MHCRSPSSLVLQPTFLIDELFRDSFTMVLYLVCYKSAVTTADTLTLCIGFDRWMWKKLDSITASRWAGQICFNAMRIWWSWDLWEQEERWTQLGRLRLIRKTAEWFGLIEFSSCSLARKYCTSRLGFTSHIQEAANHHGLFTRLLSLLVTLVTYPIHRPFAARARKGKSKFGTSKDRDTWVQASQPH